VHAPGDQAEPYGSARKSSQEETAQPETSDKGTDHHPGGTLRDAIDEHEQTGGQGRVSQGELKVLGGHEVHAEKGRGKQDKKVVINPPISMPPEDPRPAIVP